MSIRMECVRASEQFKIRSVKGGNTQRPLNPRETVVSFPSSDSRHHRSLDAFIRLDY